jgi:hypothetical protein
MSVSPADIRAATNANTTMMLPPYPAPEALPAATPTTPRITGHAVAR